MSIYGHVKIKDNSMGTKGHL